MKKYRMAAWSPLEVGDRVLVRGTHVIRNVEDILTVYSLRTGKVRIRYALEGDPELHDLRELVGRLDDRGRVIAITDERTACERVRGHGG